MGRPARVRLATALFAIVALALAATLAFLRRSGPERLAPLPPAAPPSLPDEAALAAFAARGIAPPRTVFARELPGAFDPAFAREAIAEARPAKLDRRARGTALDDAAAPAAEAPPAEPGAEPERWSRGAVALGSSEEGDEEDEGAGEAVLFAPRGEPAESPQPAPSGESEAPQRLDVRLVETPRLGKILYQDEEGKYASLVPRALRVQALVEGPRARTVVDCVFSNPHPRRLQGTFYYPLPAGASPAAFGMFRGTARVPEEAFREGRLLPPVPNELPALPNEDAALEALAPARVSETEPEPAAYLVGDWGELQRARVVEARRATEVYEAVVRRDVDPALLEWSGGNTFQARVFPIEPSALKRVILVYEETLPVAGDLLRYAYPIPAERELGTIRFILWNSEAHAALFAVEGFASPPEPAWSRGGLSRYELAVEPGKLPALDLALRPANPAAQVLESSRGLPGAAFFVRLRPPLEARPSSSPTGRALFLLDTSLSREGSGHGTAVELLEKVLEGDATIREYAVLLFDIRARWLHAPAWRPNEPARREETLAELGRIYLEGATSFDAVLAELEGQTSWIFEAEKPVTAFLLSDGFLTWGQDRVEVLLKKRPIVSRARWISYGLGNAARNQDLFDALARASAGRTVTILTREELAAGALAHRTAPAVLKSVAVEGAEARDLVVAGEPRFLFSGQELRIAGRLEAAPSGAELVVRAERDGEEVSFRVPLRGSGGSALAARAWAELYAARLLALDDERLRRLIVALSQRFRLANRVASFLILDREEDYEEFAIEGEAVDLAEIENSRAREEDQRLDRLQGIALDEAPELGRAVVARLAELARGREPPIPPLPLLDRPLAGGEGRIEAEVSYRKSRAENDLDAKAYDAVGRARALAGDTLGALRAYSSLVEKLPADAEAARFAGYACMALGQYELAAELFERTRLRRPFEPQAYLEEALALSAKGDWGGAARAYEIVLARAFPRHDGEAKVVAAYEYARLLRARLREDGIPEDAREAFARRLAELSAAVGDPFEPIDLQVTIHWNADSVDIDLWVDEPEGERCYYSNAKTRGGGKLHWDVTDGYGPELYQRRHAAPGGFEILVHYYGNRSARWTVPAAVLLVRDRKVFGPEDEFTRRFQMRLLAEADAALELGKEEF